MAEKDTLLLAGGAIILAGAAYYLYSSMKKTYASEPLPALPQPEQAPLRSTTIARSFGSDALRATYGQTVQPAQSSTAKGYVPAQQGSVASRFGMAYLPAMMATPSGIFGLSTETISEFQSYLTALGYLDNSQGDGSMNPATVQAVKVFQKNHAMPQSGNLDDATMSVIRSAYDAMMAAKA